MIPLARFKLPNCEPSQVGYVNPKTERMSSIFSRHYIFACYLVPVISLAFYALSTKQKNSAFDSTPRCQLFCQNDGAFGIEPILLILIRNRILGRDE